PLDAGATEADVDAQIAKRIRRQDVLYEPGKQVQLVMGEAALHGRPGATGTLLGQLDKLISVAGLPTVELGIIPLGTLPVMPVSGFAVYDTELVLVETLTGEQRINNPEEVATYAKAFELLRGAAVTGPDSTALIQRVAGSLR
nr:DUF5753 domain-containing protein [Actinomycetota bacterium]